MYKSALILLSLNISSSALAAWTAVGDSDNFVTYADHSSLSRVGNNVQIASMMDFKSIQTPPSSAGGGSFQSMVRQLEFDCMARQIRQISISFYSARMAGGSVVMRKSDLSKAWNDVGSGTMNEVIWKVACGK